MNPLWVCWPGVKQAAKHAFRHHHHTRRIVRHIRRSARVVVSKPAAVVWVCVATGGFWAGWPAPQPVARPYTEMSPTSPGQNFGGFVLPIEEQQAEFPLPPLAFAAPPDCCSPGPLFPWPPGQPSAPVPEPPALTLLALPAVVAILIARRA